MNEADARSGYLPGSFSGFLAESRISQSDPNSVAAKAFLLSARKLAAIDKSEPSTRKLWVIS